MPKCDFKKVALLIEITLWHGCSAVNLLHVFRMPFIRPPLESYFWTFELLIVKKLKILQNLWTGEMNCMNYSVICINGSWKESWVIISHVAVIKRFVLFSINIFFFSQVYTFHKTAERGRKSTTLLLLIYS